MRVIITQRGIPLQAIQAVGRTFFVVPESGGEFEVTLENNEHSRKEAVVAVDGINVLNGERATFDGPGYVLRGQQKASIPGWSRGSETVARFTFESPERSYVGRMGLDQGGRQSVGVAVFAERYSVAPRLLGATLGGGGGFESTMRGGTLSAGGTKGVGAGYGAETEFRTREVQFERATREPESVIIVEYATREQLLSWGIPVPPIVPAAFAPRPSANRVVPEPPPL